MTYKVEREISASFFSTEANRFLPLKNLATVFLQQGCNFHENALRCYLHAVEIDSKDSVVWNQLGTLSCSMGLFSISRWAFEQGFNFETLAFPFSCFYVKNTIVESEPIPFSPRVIDKLEHKHVRLKFQNKRKAIDDELVEGVAAKKLNQNLDVHLAEATSTASC
ncbi:hypothetical protein POM88_028075 [Heracleum sosnowskyi]|uniref:Uncharacterized protein n=1 Tax=Heracleum sosnowskyi TaxID=360622 RepID=A0AAD8MQ52_9APIA|nr:hypothetical protein POM88_028075 [Heracleum sosnowskyi]